MTELTDAEHRRGLLPETYDAFTTLYIQGKGWVFVQLTVKGKKVAECRVSAPDMKMLIMDQFKIAVAKHWKKENG